MCFVWLLCYISINILRHNVSSGGSLSTNLGNLCFVTNGYVSLVFTSLTFDNWCHCLGLGLGNISKVPVSWIRCKKIPRNIGL